MRKEKYITERRYKTGTVFEVNFRYFDNNGIKRTYTKSFHSKHYATLNECLDDAIRDRDSARYRLDTVGLKKDTVHTVKDVYEQAKELFPLSYETHRKQDLRFNKCIAIYADHPISEIKAKDITMTLNKMRHLSQDTINHVFAIWKRIFKCALLSDYISSDETLKVIVPRSEKIETHRDVKMSCSLDDVIKAVLKYGPNEFNAKIIAYALITMAYTGIRPSECYALTKKDIDLKNKTISINKAIGTTHDKKDCIKKTKNINSIRVLPINTKLVAIMQELFKLQKNYLFVKKNGEFINANYATTFIKNACKKTGIEFRSYMLRHNFSTTLIQNGIDIRTIQELMGHASGSMTIDYARSNDDLKVKAIETIEP